MARWVLQDRQYDSLVPRSPAWGPWGKAWTLSWGYAVLTELFIFTHGAPAREIRDPHEEGPGFLPSCPGPKAPQSEGSKPKVFPRHSPSSCWKVGQGLGFLLCSPLQIFKKEIYNH